MFWGRGSSVGIANRLRAGRTGVPISIGEFLVSKHVQTGPRAHPSSTSTGTSFPGVGGVGVNQPERDFDHSSAFGAEVVIECNPQFMVYLMTL